VTDFELTMLPGLPVYGEQARAFSATGMGTQSEGLVVSFKPATAGRLTGNFIRGLTKFDLLIAHPNGHDAPIIAGGQGYVIDPIAERLNTAARSAVRCCDRGVRRNGGCQRA
jgi:hypothetical protein